MYKIEHLPIASVFPNPGNPRLIKDKSFKRLVKSLADCPSLFEARPLICSNRTGKLVVLGGNMRLAAAKELKMVEVPVIVMPSLTEDQEREVAVKDNGTWGEWDFDILANEWSDLPLAEWGLDLPEDWLKQAELQEAEPQNTEPQQVEPKIDDISRQCLWQRNHPDKFKAQSLCKNNPGKVIVLYECSCEADNKKHNHHFDYSRAFEVVKLCEKCHVIEHLRLRKFEKEN